MISQETLAQISQKIIATGIDESIITLLRSEYSPVHFTYCSDDDIPNNDPVLEHEHFNLYLIDGHDHCMCLTNNFESATGVVVAEIYSD
ncbi:hypothetical protein AU255_14830 [Methyloprofundus sedimenti]|uniref:DUF6129 domain-containing protein n=1 Tax=Methyloprofundus sedimenti TaxID=1420851 RepID=A0A1V8M1R3_9GAMM|nr:DUF6129 family protein [Methyloprofundus sedimenti]OQK15499.1 hypothetical protein AU255_14830 [Methyloprofundus sedimenti]